MVEESSSGRVRIDYVKALYFAFWGAGGGAAGALLAEQTYSLRELLPGYPVVHIAIWFGVVGALVALFLLVGQSLYLRNGFALRKNTWFGSLYGGLSGLGAGAVAQMIYQTGPNELLRVLCWGIAGGLLGFSMSFRIPNLGRLRGGCGGFIGGLLGGILFIVLSLVLTEFTGRLGGIALIGGFIGLMIVFAETLFRELWLEVAYGPKELRTISLGAEPISFGGDASVCTVYAQGVEPKAYIYSLDLGKVVCDDLARSRRSELQPGHQQQIGKLTVTVRGASPIAVAKAPLTAPEKQNNTPSPTITTTLALKFTAKRVYPLSAGRQFTSREISGLESASGIVAEVNTNPQDARVLGLKNLSQREWEVKMPDGGMRRIQAGQSVKLAVGGHIRFGIEEADVIAV